MGKPSAAQTHLVYFPPKHAPLTPCRVCTGSQKAAANLTGGDGVLNSSHFAYSWYERNSFSVGDAQTFTTAVLKHGAVA